VKDNIKFFSIVLALLLASSIILTVCMYAIAAENGDPKKYNMGSQSDEPTMTPEERAQFESEADALMKKWEAEERELDKFDVAALEVLARKCGEAWTYEFPLPDHDTRITVMMKMWEVLKTEQLTYWERDMLLHFVYRARYDLFEFFTPEVMAEVGGVWLLNPHEELVYPFFTKFRPEPKPESNPDALTTDEYPKIAAELLQILSELQDDDKVFVNIELRVKGVNIQDLEAKALEMTGNSEAEMEAMEEKLRSLPESSPEYKALEKTLVGKYDSLLMTYRQLVNQYYAEVTAPFLASLPKDSGAAELAGGLFLCPLHLTKKYILSLAQNEQVYGIYPYGLEVGRDFG